MNCAAKNAGKRRRWKTSGTLINGPEITNMNLVYKNECQHWRNIINKAKKNPNFPADRLEEMQAAFEAFKKEALQRKRAIKTEKASPKEFTDWLVEQTNIILDLEETER